MEYVREEWNIYKERLISYGYSLEQIAEAEKIRNSDNFEYISFEQFDMLFRQGVVKRTRKLRKPRSLYTDGDKIYYLEHFSKKYEWCGHFINEEE